MTLNYMLCCLLLKNDLNKFRQLFETCYPPTNVLPKAYQEAFLEMAKIGMIDIRRFPIDQINTFRYRRFIEMVAKGKDEELEKQFGDTWWHYSYLKMKEMRAKNK